MPPDLVKLAERAVDDIDGWDIERLCFNMERIAAKWSHRLRECAACDREPVYAVHQPGARYCDLCRSEAA